MPDTRLNPDDFMIGQGSPVAASPDDFMSSVAGSQDPFQRLLNRPTNAPLAVLQGAGKGVASTGYGLLDLANKVVPHPIETDPEYRRSLTEPSGLAQTVGKFGEQAAEFALPEKGAAALLEKAPALLRIGGKGLVGAGVAAAQSGGDPLSTALGGTFGAGAEAVGTVAKVLREAEPSPTLANFSRALAATPKQNIAVTRGLDTLKADGVIPQGTLAEMRGAIKTQLQKLKDAYKQLPADIQTREYDPYKVIAEIDKKVKTEFSRGEVDLPGNDAIRKAYKEHVDTIELLAAQNPNGKLSFKDLKALRDSANKMVNWAAPDAERNAFEDLGGVYRNALDKLAPETTPLNRRYAQYKQLESVADHNFEMGKGEAPSGLGEALKHKVTSPVVGAEFGAALGSHFGPVGSAAGALIGATVYPKLSEAAVSALRNASENGVLAKFNPMQNYTLQQALKRSDTKAILKLIGTTSAAEAKGSAFEATTGGLTR